MKITETKGLKRLILALTFPEVFEEIDKLQSERIKLEVENKELKRKNESLKGSINYWKNKIKNGETDEKNNH